MMFSTMQKIFSRAHSAPEKASCPPNQVIPTVRLQGRDWLFGFAPASSTNTTRGFFYIDRPSEAQLSYILGPEWRSLIITKAYPKIDSHMRPISGQVVTSQYIARPDDDEDNEAEHCLRMRRCGAVFVTGLEQMRALTDHNVNGGAPFGLQEIERHIFGWPETGGVWIYRIPQEVFAAHDAHTSGTGPLYLRPDNYEDVVAAVNNLKINVKKQEDMQQVVNLLKDAGASFYDNIEDCPEVVKLKLVSPTKNGEEIIPPSEQLHDTWLIE